ncbi:unnamed protein product [Euphydryas editha]|uniref:Uncharacterized protein n=1 Tax=Euphydryas editha TaxID=104508 RepID=A0AAU9UYG8_EUPED|nr:unnamed protein product [Euphydryas editha]
MNSEIAGPYQIEYLKYETCKGPKRDECGTVRIDSIRNMSDIPFILSLPKDCPVKSAKVIIGTVQNSNKTKKLWNYSLNKPCQHFVLGPLLIKKLNLTYNNCNLVKGHYEVHINMNELTTKFLGSNFFYDTYFFKTMAYNNANNFFCVYTVMKLFKP